MHRVGDEQRIRMLFSELRVEQEMSAPQFATIWHRAKSGKIKSKRASSLSLMAASTLIFLTFFSIAVWLRAAQTAPVDVSAISIPSLLPQSTLVLDASSAAKKNSDFLRLDEELSEVRLRPTSSGRRKMRKTLIHQDRFIPFSTWESPTAYLMHSPAEEILTSIPNFDQAVAELTVLPTN